MKIWDNHNKQWLDVTSIYFKNNESNERVVWRITAIKPGDDALSDGWYDIQGEDLNQIAIDDMVKMNTELLP